MKRRIVLSRIMYFAALCIAVVCAVRLLIELVCPNEYSFEVSFRRFFCCRFKVESAKRLFPLVGIVNFTFPYLITSRAAKIKGISLYKAINTQFNWHVNSYIIHAALVLLGLWCVELTHLYTNTFVCLIGTFLILISTSLVTWMIALDADLTKTVLENYLVSYSRFDKRQSYRKDDQSISQYNTELLLESARYIHQCFVLDASVPDRVFLKMIGELGKRSKNLLKVLELKTPIMFYNYSNVLGDNYIEKSIIHEAVEEIVFIRTIWEIIIGKQGDKNQIKCIQSLMLVMAEELNKRTGYIQPYSMQFAFTRRNMSFKCHPFTRTNAVNEMGLVLCGLISFFRSSNQGGPEQKEYWKTANCTLELIANIGVFSPFGESFQENSIQFTWLYRFLIVLFVASSYVEQSLLFPSELSKAAAFRESLNSLCKQFNIDDSWISYFFIWGHAIIISAFNRWNNPEKNLITSFWALERFKSLN